MSLVDTSVNTMTVLRLKRHLQSGGLKGKGIMGGMIVERGCCVERRKLD
ncbi:MAG: hypothetical protein Q7U07_06980 [Gammaproteobacteria bacterium]|nr:hypothetical protein [Gammaproteobacteria bacterium]